MGLMYDPIPVKTASASEVVSLAKQRAEWRQAMMRGVTTEAAPIALFRALANPARPQTEVPNEPDQAQEHVTPEPRVTVARVLHAVAKHYGVSIVDLKSNRRHRPLVYHRQVVMYLARALTSASLPEIGLRIGGKDHTTILHGARVTAKRAETDDVLRADLQHLEKLIVTGTAL